MPTREMQGWLDHWKFVNELEEEELRNTPPEMSLRQLEALHASIDVFGWREELGKGEEEVRQRWILLKEKYGIRNK